MDALGHTNGILSYLDAITPITCYFPVKKFWLVALCMHHSEDEGCARHIRRVALQYKRQCPSPPSPSLMVKS
jgi:hypothetical protein